jgi:uncharacterized protein involved in exopolysaccharide biosynthesis
MGVVVGPVADALTTHARHKAWVLASRNAKNRLRYRPFRPSRTDSSVILQLENASLAESLKTQSWILTNRMDEREFTLKELRDILLRGKWLIISVTIGFASSALIASLLLPKKYDAVILVAPVASTSGGSQLGALGSLASQFGGLASLAGFSTTGDSKKAESNAVLQSEALTEKYIQTNDLLPVLYAKKWDSQRMRWKKDDIDYIPTLWTANRDFKKLRNVTIDSKTGLLTMKITWKDPARAAKWANGLVRLTNDYLRNKAISESERNIAYLNEEAAKTNVVEARQAIYSILQTEINKIMLARGSEEYAFKILDPAAVSEKASFPQPFLWVLAGFLGGLFFSVAWVLTRSSWS